MTLSETKPDEGVQSSTRALSRWPVTAVFFLNGLVLTAYVVRLPALKEALHLSDAQIGVQTGLFAGAALLAMQVVPRLLRRLGAARLLGICLAAMSLLLVGVALVPDFGWLLALSLLLGALQGVTDTTMNATAVEVQQQLGRSVLNGCHAAWSISAVVVSLVTTATAPSTLALFLAVGAVVLVAAAIVTRLPWPDTAPAPQEVGPTDPRPARVRRGWTRPLLLLCATAAIVMVCDGATLDWGGILLHEHRAATLALSATVVGVYTGAQAAVRLLADRLADRIEAGALFRVAGLLGAAGLVLALLAPHPLLALVGFALFGAGTAPLLPLLFSAAGATDPADRARATARLTTCTYLGVLGGPALIGWAATTLTLPGALLCLIPALAAAAILRPIRARTGQPERGSSRGPPREGS